jgi:CheY-like chemotaxis protein
LHERPQDFDVLLSDTGMPPLDGYELIRSVRAELGLRPSQMPAVVITQPAQSSKGTAPERLGTCTGRESG